VSDEDGAVVAVAVTAVPFAASSPGGAGKGVVAMPLVTVCAMMGQ